MAYTLSLQTQKKEELDLLFYHSFALINSKLNVTKWRLLNHVTYIFLSTLSYQRSMTNGVILKKMLRSISFKN